MTGTGSVGWEADAARAWAVLVHCGEDRAWRMWRGVGKTTPTGVDASKAPGRLYLSRAVVAGTYGAFLKNGHADFGIDVDIYKWTTQPRGRSANTRYSMAQYHIGDTLRHKAETCAFLKEMGPLGSSVNAIDPILVFNGRAGMQVQINSEAQKWGGR